VAEFRNLHATDSIMRGEEWVFAMKYRGIEYDIKMGAGEDVWVWTVHTPNPKRGIVTGARVTALRAAEEAIKAWCYQHPLECEPAAA
jgi:hypothetical protein